MKTVRIGLVALFASLASFAHAVPGTFSVPITFDPPSQGEVPASYRVYEGCDLLDQTLSAATLIGAVTSGQTVTVPGDSDTPPVLCVVPVFAGSVTGPFDDLIDLDVTAQYPVENINATCSFTPDDAGNIAQWTCVAN